MAHYTAHTINLVFLSEPITSTLTESPLVQVGKPDLGAASKGVFTVVGKSSNGFLARPAWGASRENRSLIVPTSIDGGLIAANQVYNITLWNAGTIMTLVDITTNSPLGYTLTGPGIGLVSMPETESSWVLTVTVDGPSAQDTLLTFVFDTGEEFEVRITGRRVEVLAFPINAVDGLEVKYHWETVVYRNEKFKEQRRALRDIPHRTLKARFSFLDDLLQRERFLNQLYLYQQRIIAIPYMIEEMSIASDPQGSTTINLGSGEASNRFELVENAQFCVIYNERDGDIKEMCEIVSIGGDTITVDTPVVRSYDPLYSYVAPAFLCYVPAPEMALLTARTADFTMEFKEYL
jgi:hypothetical protein